MCENTKKPATSDSSLDPNFQIRRDKSMKSLASNLNNPIFQEKVLILPSNLYPILTQTFWYGKPISGGSAVVSLLLLRLAD